ncbi:hypothetical protein FKR81_20675 [Lentzea tibetensis]|uniref:ESAT-6 protein secretion system EspG family protein n=1 Tax=Lentzea tibetensis TaxID=2591470 RepID=A0A563ESG2_9PSEU|nr:hypothetical protein [Lentzea tibetensis]TWP50583.1 hypothetical protein FKR81_20675 [Lentzea tibetensis]
MTLTLTTDELRVAAGLSGRRLPVDLDGGWSTEDIPVADTVALRGLLARGLATACADELAVSLSAQAAPVTALFEPGAVIEVRRDGAQHTGRWLVTERAGCAESRPDLWSFAPFDIDFLVTDLLSALPDEPSDANPIRVRTDHLVETDRRLARGEAAGTDLARLLRGTRVTTTVRRVEIDGAQTAAAVTWLETTDAGAWLAVPFEGEEDMESHRELRPVRREHLHALVLDVIKGGA